MANGQPTQTAVIIERLDSIRADLYKIQARLDTQEQDRVQFREAYLVEHTALKALATKTAETVDRHTKEIDALEEMVKPVVWSNRIVSTVAILLGTAIIALVWQLITGQAQVFFR